MIKRIILSAVATVVLAAGLDFCLGKTLRHFYFKETSGDQFRTTFAMDQTDSGILVFGSSRAKFHYVPDVFQNAFRQSFYNVGRDAQSIFFQAAVLKSIVKRYSPRLIILEFDGDFSSSPGEYDRMSSLLPYYQDHPEVRKYVELRSPFELIKLKSQVYPFNSMIVSIAGGNLAMNKQRSNDDRGYVRASGEWKEPIEVAESNLHGPVDPNKVAAFTEFLTAAKGSGANVFIVNSPVFKRYTKNDGQALAKQLCRENGVDYIDHSASEEFITDGKLFKDVSHLNYTGAVKFSELLASEINRSLAAKVHSGQAIGVH